MADTTTYRLPLRTASHVLALLGDQLIGDEKLAIFELVKNSYDADANHVRVTMHLEGTHRSIIVEDDGHGMDASGIGEGWLYIGNSSKRAARSLRSQRFGRLPLGEKGVGRLAAFKLGSKITLITRTAEAPEFEVQLDLDELLTQGPLMQDLSASMTSRITGKVFAAGHAGTRIEITSLRRNDWSRGDIRRMQRLITSLASPFSTPDHFEVMLDVPGREQELGGTLGLEQFLESAPWRFEFWLDEVANYTWKYEFSPPNWKALQARVLNEENGTLLLLPREPGESSDPAERGRVVLEQTDLKGVGPVHGVIYGYFRRSEVLKASGALQQLTMWLDDQTGVRIYRDGVRVFTYGEKTDDWLGLNIRRINRPTGKFGSGSI